MRIQSLALSALLLSVAFALPALASGPEIPWKVALGEEKLIWIAEPMDESVYRYDLDAGMKSVALSVEVAFAGESHDNLLGLAFPPEFGMGRTHDFVYLVFAYDRGQSAAAQSGRHRIVQYQWDAESGRLSDPVELQVR